MAAEPTENKSMMLALAILFIVFLIVLVSIIAFNQPKASDTVTTTTLAQQEQITEPALNEKQTEIIELDVSFDEYLDNLANYDNKKVAVTGFLKNTIVESELIGIKYVNSVIDDFGNEILLSKLTSAQNAMFQKGLISEILFNVTGYLRSKQDGVYLEVISIKSTARPTKTVEI